MKFGIVGAIAHPGVDMSKVNYSKDPWAAQPQEMISYVSCHDDMCLADRIKCTLDNIAKKKNPKSVSDPAARRRLQKLAETAVLTSQGVPFIWNGDEIMRDKKGVHNSFSSPDSINTIPWVQKTEYKDVFDYVASLVKLRKSHPAFRMGNAELVRQHLHFLDAPDGVVAFELNGEAVSDDWKTIVVVLNANREEVTINLPEGSYQIALTTNATTANTETATSQTGIPAQTALILYTTNEPLP